MALFKDQLSPELVRLIAHHITKTLPSFDSPGFEQRVLNALPSLELKERVLLISEALHEYLPIDVNTRYRALKSALHPDDEHHANAESDGDGLCGFGIWPLTQLVGSYGLEHFDASLALLKEMTKRGTAEFDVRPYIIADQARAFKVFEDWASDPNHHVRRLVSEGTRPRLPWGVQLKELIRAPAPGLRLISQLRDDPSEYVRRSVANHLNDIAKDHPERVAAVAADWMRNASPQRERLVRHGCRTLIKQGHSPTLAVFGYSAPKIHKPSLNIRKNSIEFGDSLHFELSITSDSPANQSIILDYVIHFRKASGRTSAKVFKWTKLTLPPGETVVLTRAHAFVPITTRRYYPGEHALEVRINGEDYCLNHFSLNM